MNQTTSAAIGAKPGGRLLGNAAALLFVQVLTMALPLMSLPYLSRALGADGYGRILFSFSVTQVASIFCDYGFAITGPRDVSLNRHDRDRVSKIWGNITAVKLIFTMIFFAILLLSSLFVDQMRENRTLLLLSFSTTLGSALSPFWLFQGLEKMVLISFLQLVGKALPFVLCFYLVHDSSDIYYAAGLQAIGNVLPALIGLYLTMRVVDASLALRIKVDELWGVVVDGIDIFLSNVAVNVYTAVNMMTLGFIVSPAAVAQYGLADKICKAVQTLYSQVSNTFFPRLVDLAKHDPFAAKQQIRRLLLWGGSIAFFVSLAVTILATKIVLFLFGPEYRGSAEILQFYIWIAFLVYLSNVAGVLTMVPFGLLREFRRMLGLAAIVNILTFPLLTYLFWTKGAVIANLIVEVIVVAGMMLILNKRQLLKAGGK